MSVEYSESRGFQPKIRLNFPEADLGTTSTPEMFFFGISQKFGTCHFDDGARSKLCLKNYDGYLSNSKFLWELCVSIDIGLGASPRALVSGCGGGLMDEERLRLLLRGGDSGSAFSMLGRMSGMPLGALF